MIVGLWSGIFVVEWAAAFVSLFVIGWAHGNSGPWPFFASLVFAAATSFPTLALVRLWYRVALWGLNGEWK